jgi:hypothetical protein
VGQDWACFSPVKTEVYEFATYLQIYNGLIVLVFAIVLSVSCVVVIQGSPPYFVDAMFTTKYVLYTTPSGSVIFTATAANDEILQKMTYSYVSEVPSPPRYFDVDTVTGMLLFVCHPLSSFYNRLHAVVGSRLHY